MATDRELIEHLGGPAKVAELLNYDKNGGVQRVHNWMTRGIPARVKLDHPEIFLQGIHGSPVTPLQRARHARKLSLEQVADAVGTDTGNLSRIERGQQVPSKVMAEKLAQYFGNQVTETQIIYPERFMVPDEAEPAPETYTGPDRRTGEEPDHLLPRKRAANGH